MIIISGEDFAAVCGGQGPKRVTFSKWDEDVYNGLSHTCLGADKVEGSVWVHDAAVQSVPDPTSTGVVRVELVKLRPDDSRERGRQVYCNGGHDYFVKGYVQWERMWQEHEVQVVPVKEDLFSRARGLLETGKLATLTVLIKGQGSVGSTVTRLLAQSGICRFILLDNDRLTVANLIRHEGGLSYIGRFKTRVMAELIREKNPYAEVYTFEQKLKPHNRDFVRTLVREATVCIDTADEREGRQLLNRLCLEEKKPLIIGGAFRRAYGGQVLRIRPGETPCYQCFAQLFKKDSNPYPTSETERAAYSDLPVPIEPGLSIDIDPISHMTAKVALQELLKDVPTTMRSLDEDLKANWYLWLNRREAGTPYESLEPLGFGMDTMTILRWYGIQFDQDPACRVCGDFVSAFARRTGLPVTDERLAEFKRLHGPLEAAHGG